MPAALRADPLTGRRPAPGAAVVAVKIDNSPLARRFHRGFDSASLVYQELVEGGASRFLVVFAPAPASEVGPVRSVRESDVELVRQFGKIPLASSGGNPGTLATVAKAARAGSLVDAGYDIVPGVYRRGERRKDAFNFFVVPQAVERARPGGTQVKDVGLRFGVLPRGAGTSAPRASVRFSPIARVTVQYEPARGSYAVFQDGYRMRDFAPTNVVVQRVPLRGTPYRDTLGHPTPYTVTVGSGAVDLLRDGRRLPGTWRRPAPQAGTRFVDAGGRDLPLKPGASLVLLVPSGRALHVG